MVEIQNPQTLAVKALIVSICNAAIAFGVFGAHTATEIESIGVVAIALVAMGINALHHKVNMAYAAEQEHTAAMLQLHPPITAESE